MDEKVRLLLVDDHTLFREGLARLLEAEYGLELIGSCASPEEAFTILEARGVDVVLLDFDLGTKNGLHFFREFEMRKYPGRILMVTAGMRDADTVSALKNGVAGIFLKHNPPADLITAIRRVARGETWLDSNTMRALVAGSAEEERSRKADSLNDREQAVLKGVFEGLTNKEIGARLNISESYVKALLQQLFEKTGVRTRSQLVRVALERNLQ
ncbi:response regulator [Silvibacterium acidisoli]|uniref:response regulator n=1 Tax=Acidobacteriaceae bacterium ZG23-2 TaxID=2883246 RepID=UPI00406CCF0A